MAKNQVENLQMRCIFTGKFTSDEWVQRDYNTSEDIAEANRLLDIILGK